MRVPIKDLRIKILNVLSKNMSEKDSQKVTDYIMWAEMSGNSTQGITKLTGESPIQEIKPDYPIKIEKETPVSALLDGGKGSAIVVADRALEIVAKKANETGIAIVGARNTFSSNGAQSYHVEKLAKKDLIGIIVSRSPGTVSAFNSIDPLLGTNPIGFAFPTNDEPIVFDAATSAMTFYGLVIARAHKQQLPEGVATDKNGNPTTDPNEAIDGGAVKPFGNSYKAAGLGMLVELLSGPLINGAYLDYKTYDKEWGTTFIAINPNILVDVDKFKAACSDFVSIIRNSRTKPNEKIHMPHDRSRKNYNECMASSFVEVDDVIYKEVFGDQ
jgi:LDH2 family malate/lactate/ureidoglycolate dehydrogenase